MRLLAFMAVVLALLSLTVAGSLLAREASVAEFANGSTITIQPTPNTSMMQRASPYPSSIPVSGLTGKVQKVTATLRGLSVNDPWHINVLLVAPNGAGVVLMDNVGGFEPVNNLTLTFDDDAPGPIPESTPTSGTYRPSTNPGQASHDTMPSPAPSPPYAQQMAAFDGIDPNGSWSLYVASQGSDTSGSIANGWALTIETEAPPAPAEPTERTELERKLKEPKNQRSGCPPRKGSSAHAAAGCNWVVKFEVRQRGLPHSPEPPPEMVATDTIGVGKIFFNREPEEGRSSLGDVAGILFHADEFVDPSLVSYESDLKLEPRLSARYRYGKGDRRITFQLEVTAVGGDFGDAFGRAGDGGLMKLVNDGILDDRMNLTVGHGDPLRPGERHTHRWSVGGKNRLRIKIGLPRQIPGCPVCD